MFDIEKYIAGRIKLRKIFTTVLSVSSLLFICGICSAALDASSNNIPVNTAISVNPDSSSVNIIPEKKTPREIVMERRTAKIRTSLLIALCTVMAASFILELSFIRCPYCNKHIPYGSVSEQCVKCNKSFKNSRHRKLS